jgi:tRNA-dihydrouridine synthase B
MEDVTDIGFRKLCKRYGASMVYTEFVSADAIIRNIKSTLDKMKIDDEERPVGIQIYGRDVESMVEAAKMVESVHPDVIDLNFGCPVKKVAGKGAGAGMLRNIPLLLDITREVVKAVHTPVTVKTRLGWDQNNLIITDLAERLQDCGIQALTIHGRTRSQMYTGNADWTLIGEVKRNPRIHIPIIGNGDIATPEQALHAFEEYGVDAVMIGRATFGQPWIFREMRHAIDTAACDGLKTEVKTQQETAERQQGQDVLVQAGQPSGQEAEGLQGKEKEYRPLTLDEKIDILEEQLRINIERIDEKRGILHTRRHLAASPIFKGIPDFRQTRIAMLRAETEEELVGILEKCRELLRPYQGTQEL